MKDMPARGSRRYYIAIAIWVVISAVFLFLVINDVINHRLGLLLATIGGLGALVAIWRWIAAAHGNQQR